MTYCLMGQLTHERDYCLVQSELCGRREMKRDWQRSQTETQPDRGSIYGDDVRQ